ncbi:MAG: patatin-like phospholipase family protein [Solirubrobacteraceae bacterium]
MGLPREGTALCLSGGGYRAMLFHVGALWRLNELGWIARLNHVSSVSGGSITAGTLGRSWSDLAFDADGVAGDFSARLVHPIRKLAGCTIDMWAVISGILTPGSTISAMVARAYDRAIFNGATLQDLPDEPRFVINATSLQTGVLWRFTKAYMADYTIGLVPNPSIKLAQAVAASSAFPPVLSPMKLKLDPRCFEERGRETNYKQPFNTRAVLSDGGVYDNLGLETAWKSCTTVLVSDGGGHMSAEGRVGGDWIRQAIRVNAVIDNQVRDLRKRATIAGFQRGERTGAYWGIRSHIADFGPPAGSLPCPPDQTALLAATKTRLKAMDAALQERLINWGYAICDAAMRRWVVPQADAPADFPFPASGV